MYQPPLATIQELITIPSTADNATALAQAVDFVADLLKDIPGITIDRFEQNGKPSLLAYFTPQRPKRFDILFNAHVDVVPATLEQFVPRLENGRLYGRGSYDMKAACVVMADVFRTYGAQSSQTVGLQIVSDEETGGYDGAKLQIDAGVAADLVITGEMTDGQICNEARGLCWVDITFRGTTAHGGYPWKGDNAVAKAADAARAILQKYPHITEETWTTTANIAALSTENDTYNKVPDSATLKIDFRFTPEDPVFHNRENVQAFVESVAPGSELRFELFEPAVNVPANQPQLLQLCEAYSSITGKPATLIKRYASSDARLFALAGQHCVEFGPAGNHHHGSDEYLDVASLVPFHDTLVALLSKPRPSRP